MGSQKNRLVRRSACSEAVPEMSPEDGERLMRPLTRNAPQSRNLGERSVFFVHHPQQRLESRFVCLCLAGPFGLGVGFQRRKYSSTTQIGRSPGFCPIVCGCSLSAVSIKVTSTYRAPRL